MDGILYSSAKPMSSIFLPRICRGFICFLYLHFLLSCGLFTPGQISIEKPSSHSLSINSTLQPSKVVAAADIHLQHLQLHWTDTNDVAHTSNAIPDTVVILLLHLHLNLHRLFQLLLVLLLFLFFFFSLCVSSSHSFLTQTQNPEFVGALFVFYIFTFLSFLWSFHPWPNLNFKTN